MNYKNISFSFSGSKEELEYYKYSYYKKKEELSKCLQKIKALENFNNKLVQKLNDNNFTKISLIENNSKNNKNLNKSNNIKNSLANSSKKNSEKSYKVISLNEFKTLWESIIQTELIDNFDFCLNEYILISYICQDIVQLVYNESKNEIINKLNQVLKCLNLDKISKNKFNSIYNKFLPFFEENINDIFIFQNYFLKNIHMKLISIIKEYNYNELNVKNNNVNDSNHSKPQKKKSEGFSIEMPLLLEKKINNGHFDNLIKSFYKVCIYMLLHNPILTFRIDKYSERKCIFQYFDKNSFINVEGFGNELSPCILLLPPPLLKEKFPFYGLRAAVYIISEPDKNIYSECEINKAKNKEENLNNEVDNKLDINKIRKKKKKIKCIKIENNNRSNSNEQFRNKKNLKEENFKGFESFNYSLNLNMSNNCDAHPHKIKNIKNTKLLISNSLGDIFIKINNENNDKNNDKNTSNKKNKNKINEIIVNENQFSPNKNALSIKQNSKNRKLILSNSNQTNSLFNNYKNDINYIGNKTPDIIKKDDNAYKSFKKSLNFLKNNENIFENKEERYIIDMHNNYLYERNNKYKYNYNNKEKLNYDIINKNNNTINCQNNTFNSVKNLEKNHNQYSSEIKLKDFNNSKKNINTNSFNNSKKKLNRNQKNEINKLNENWSLDKNKDINLNSNINYFEELNLNNEHIYNRSFLVSSNNNYDKRYNLNKENMTDYNNFNYYETLNKSHNNNEEKNNPKKIQNIKLAGKKWNKSLDKNIDFNININDINDQRNKLIQNEERINILFKKNNKKFHIKTNNNKIKGNKNNNKINIGYHNSQKKFINKNNNKIKDENIIYNEVNNIKINNLFINKKEVNKKFYIIKKNNNSSNNSNKKNEKDIYTQRYFNNNNITNNIPNSFNDILYFKNFKKIESKTIETDNLIPMKYINKNNSYNNIFNNNEKYNYNTLFNDNNHEKKVMNFSNLFNSNYDEYNNINKINKVNQKQLNNVNINNKSGHNLSHYYNIY